MKVLIINGSPRANGNSTKLIKEMIGIFDKEGVEVDNYQIGSKAIRGCMACGYCTLMENAYLKMMLMI